MEFTHQGASWTNQRDKVGIPWEGSPKERQAVERDFEKAQAWAQKHNRPIFLGEFGAYDKADMESRVRYIGFVTRQAEKLGWSWAYWQFDSDFIVYDIPKKRWIEPIRDALIPRSSQMNGKQARAALVAMVEHCKYEELKMSLPSLRGDEIEQVGTDPGHVRIGKWHCRLERRTFVVAVTAPEIFAEYQGVFEQSPENGWTASIRSVSRN